MKDFFGNELAIGDEVAFERPHYRELILGVVVNFTPQNVRVEYQPQHGRGSRPQYLTNPEHVIKKVIAS